MLNFPVIIYDANSELITKTSIMKKQSLYFYSYQNLSVEIIEGDAELYSVVDNSGTLDIQNGQLFNGNFGYTLISNVNNQTIKLNITNNSTTIEYVVFVRYSNIINEYNEHYTDLLVNKKLPDYDELVPALLEDFTDIDLVKRLLLDYLEILKVKGTKESILKFLQLIGYPKDNLTILDEYYNRKSDTTTLQPNKNTDIKTGNYFVLFDNFEFIGLDDNNLPINEIIIQDLDAFLESLKYAIALANNYFTLKEQNIKFFGLNYSSNIALERGVTSHFNQIFINDVLNFRYELNIDLYVNNTSEYKNIIIDNTIQKNDQIYKTENKAIFDTTSKPSIFDQIFFTDGLIHDDEINTDNDLTKIYEFYGTLLQLDLTAVNKYVYFKITNLDNPQFILEFEKQLLTSPITKYIGLRQQSNFLIEFEIYDLHNNKEYYFYEFSVNKDMKLIDVESFNSSLLTDKNIIDQDIASNSIVNNLENYWMLPIADVPQDLATYYDQGILAGSSFLSDNNNYLLDDLNQNLTLDDITETIPLEFIDSFYQIVAIKYENNQQLKLRFYSLVDGDYLIIDIADIGNYIETSLLDNIWFSMVDIYNPTTQLNEQYYMLFTTEVGIEFIKELYDFVLVDNQLNITSIYDNPTLTIKKEPLNYDIPLFEIITESPPTFLVPYISPSEYEIDIIGNTENGTYKVMRSLFPRLIKIDETINDTYKLDFGDVIVCRLNDDYVTRQYNINWKVINAFTDKVIFETTDKTLKYRINEQTIYKINVEFLINNELQTIIKDSIFSSFEYKNIKL